MQFKYALLAATLIAAGASGVALAQRGPVYDPAQLPEVKGKVAQYLLTPRADVVGVILTDGGLRRPAPLRAACLCREAGRCGDHPRAEGEGDTDGHGSLGDQRRHRRHCHRRATRADDAIRGDRQGEGAVALAARRCGRRAAGGRHHRPPAAARGAEIRRRPCSGQGFVRAGLRLRRRARQDHRRADAGCRQGPHAVHRRAARTGRGRPYGRARADDGWARRLGPRPDDGRPWRRPERGPRRAAAPVFCTSPRGMRPRGVGFQHDEAGSGGAMPKAGRSRMPKALPAMAQAIHSQPCKLPEATPLKKAPMLQP